jgi:hypothetical protein
LAVHAHKHARTHAHTRARTHAQDGTPVEGFYTESDDEEGPQLSLQDRRLLNAKPDIVLSVTWCGTIAQALISLPEYSVYTHVVILSRGACCLLHLNLVLPRGAAMVGTTHGFQCRLTRTRTSVRSHNGVGIT